MALSRILALLANQSWNPTALGSSLIGWLDASALSTLTVNGSGQVSSWAHRVGPLPAATRTAGSAVTYSATARNSHPGVVFDGSGFLQGASDTGLPTGNSPAAMAGVAFLSASPHTQAQAFSWGTTNTNQTRTLGTDINDAIPNMAPALYLWQASLADRSAGNWNGLDKIVAINSGNSANAVYVNSDSGATSTTALNTTSNGNYQVGTNSFVVDNTYVWIGAIQEVVILNRQLTTTERQKLEGYFAWKWGLVALLPSGHPYKNVAP